MCSSSDRTDIAPLVPAQAPLRDSPQFVLPFEANPIAPCIHPPAPGLSIPAQSRFNAQAPAFVPQTANDFSRNVTQTAAAPYVAPIWQKPEQLSDQPGTLYGPGVTSSWTYHAAPYPDVRVSPPALEQAFTTQVVGPYVRPNELFLPAEPQPDVTRWLREPYNVLDRTNANATHLAPPHPEYTPRRRKSPSSEGGSTTTWSCDHFGCYQAFPSKSKLK